MITKHSKLNTYTSNIIKNHFDILNFLPQIHFAFVCQSLFHKQGSTLVEEETGIKNRNNFFISFLSYIK